MKPEQLPEEQEYDLPGQMSFFPEYESKAPAPGILLQKPIPVPDTAQLEAWKLRILMSDILARFDGALPEEWLFGIFVGNSYMSNFIYQDVLGGLLENGAARMTETDGEQTVLLTDAGRQTVRQTRLMVPKLFRDQVHLTALRYVARQKAMRDLQISYEPADSGCMLCLRCMDHRKEMFFLRISSPSQQHAEDLGERILRNPARFFGKIIDLAMTNEEEQFDLTDN